MYKHGIDWNQLLENETNSRILQIAMWRAVHKLSYMTRQVFNIDALQIHHISLAQMWSLASDPESEMVGIYLRIENLLQAQILLTLPLEDALNLADLMMYNAPGKTRNLGEMESSALAEIGNLVVSHFLNTMVNLTGYGPLLRPSPPAVMVDMLSTILSTVSVPLVAMHDDLVVIDTYLKDEDGLVNARLWMLPQLGQGTPA